MRVEIKCTILVVLVAILAMFIVGNCISKVAQIVEKEEQRKILEKKVLDK